MMYKLAYMYASLEPIACDHSDCATVYTLKQGSWINWWTGLKDLTIGSVDKPWLKCMAGELFHRQVS